MIKRCICFFLLMVVLAGCATDSAPATQVPPTSETSETTAMPAPDPMMERSLASMGSNYRIQKVLEKMESGEEITVGFIGGSITEGYDAPNGQNYAALVTQYLDNTYSDGTGKVHCINAGLSGTPSMLGLIRADRELLAYKPDLIFIEFAVNDAQSFTDKQAYEALIRKCLCQEWEPAVILLYSVTDNGYTCQNEMALTAFYYDLPAVSVRDAIMPELEAGTMAWTDWSGDEVHPHGEGHLLYSRFIIHLIDTLRGQDPDDVYIMPEEPKFSRDWTRMREYGSADLPLVSMGDFTASAAHPNFRSSFSYRGGQDSTNAGLTFEVTGTTVFLVFKSTPSAAYGTAEILVDGEVVAHLNGYNPDAWNNPVTQLIYADREIGTHTITVRMQPGDEDKSFDLLAVGIVHA